MSTKIPIRVVITEDDTEIRETLAFILKGTPGFHCAATFSSGEDLLTSLPNLSIDVILLDIGLPGISGLEVLPKIKALNPKIDCLMLTIRQDDDAIFQALSAGATGYLLKDTPPTDLLKSIQEIYHGGAPMSMIIARKIIGSFHRDPSTSLSSRELEILKLLSEGMNYRSIATALFLSPHTIKTHIKNIYAKLHVHSRAEAIKKAMKDKLI
ncbi:MAG: response regulator transcription factor [Bacteroidota bacterium]